ncbi:MAG: HAMP domain-containing protein, partial [Nitrospirota bacterium]
MVAIRNIRIGIKILGMVSFLLFFMAIVAGVSILKIKGIGDEIRSMAERDIPLTGFITEVEMLQLQQTILFEKALRFGVADEKASLRAAEEEFKKLVKTADEAVNKATTFTGEALAAGGGTAVQKKMKEVAERLKVIAKEHADFEHGALEAFELIDRGRLRDALLLSAKVEKEADQLNHELEQFVKQIEKSTEESAKQAEHDQAAALKTILAIGILALIFGSVIGIFVTKSITGPVNKIMEATRSIADGDLDKEIHLHQNDEIGKMAEAFHGMQATIKNVLQETAGLIQSAKDGKLAARGNADAFTGGWRRLVETTNELIDAFVKPVRVTADYVDRISKGDIPARITDEYKGDFNEIKNNLNALIDATSEVTELAKEIAEGNLKVTVKERSSQDELMQALASMVAKLTEVVADVKAAADNVASGSQELSASAEQMSQGATEQAAAAEEASSSMEEMSSNIRQNADNAQQTEKIAQKSAKDAQDSGTAVSEAVTAMRDIASKISII